MPLIRNFFSKVFSILKSTAEMCKYVNVKTNEGLIGRPRRRREIIKRRSRVWRNADYVIWLKTGSSVMNLWVTIPVYSYLFRERGFV
jgi:hypothetical protein